MKTKSGKVVSKIGIGTWTINSENINQEVETLHYYFNKGVNYIDAVLAYDGGKVLDVLAEFIKSVKREDIYINAFITYGCNSLDDIEKQIDFYLKKFNTDYLDCVTLHGPDAIGFEVEAYFAKITELKKSKPILNIGFSNISPEDFGRFSADIDLFEGVYNLECKINEHNGILEGCRKQNIPFVAYQPLRRNRTAKQNYPVLIALADKYGKTQNQIIINWLSKHKNVLVIIKASQKQHIDENLAALDFDIDKADYELLDNFKSEFFDNLQISYKKEEGKIPIYAVPNQEIV